MNRDRAILIAATAAMTSRNLLTPRSLITAIGQVFPTIQCHHLCMRPIRGLGVAGVSSSFGLYLERVTEHVLEHVRITQAVLLPYFELFCPPSSSIPRFLILRKQYYPQITGIIMLPLLGILTEPPSRVASDSFAF